MSHAAKVFYNLQDLLDYMLGPEDDIDERWTKDRRDRAKRYWIKIWKKCKKPLVIKCAVCSGKEHKIDIKKGKWKISTRQEQKDLKEQLKE